MLTLLRAKSSCKSCKNGGPMALTLKNLETSTDKVYLQRTRFNKADY